MIAVLLSFGAVYAYIPVIIIVILIVAAAGLSRGADIFAVFGIGTLIGAGAIKKGQGFGGAFKTKNDLLSRTANATKLGKGASGGIKGIRGFRGKRISNVMNAARRAANLKWASVGGRGLMSAAAIAAATKATGGNRVFRKEYQRVLTGLAAKAKLNNEARGSPVKPSLKGEAGTAGAAAIKTGAEAAEAAAGRKKSGWSTRMSPKEYLLSEAKGMKEGHMWNSKTIIKPGSPKTTIDMLAVKANPRNLDENLRNAGNKKEARVYFKEQQSAWNELLRRSKKDDGARKAVNGLLNIYGLKHPRANSNEAYTASGQRDASVDAFEKMYAKYKKAGWSPSKHRSVMNEEEASWLKEKLKSDAGAGAGKRPGLDELYRWPNFARSARSHEQSTHSMGNFSRAMKAQAKRVKEATDSEGNPIANTTLTGSGWKKYYKETKRARKKKP